MPKDVMYFTGNVCVLGEILTANCVSPFPNLFEFTSKSHGNSFIHSGDTSMLVLFAFAERVSAIIATLVTWWSGTPNALYGNRFEGAQFDTQNIVPVAWDMLEEDLEKERFFALARRTYWDSKVGSTRALMQTLIGKLDF